MQSDLTTDPGIVNPDTGFCGQARPASCAAAAGAMLLWYVGIIVTEAEMRRRMGTGDTGTTDAGILAGLAAKLAEVGSPWMVVPMWGLDLAKAAAVPGVAMLLHENIPDPSDPTGGIVGHAVVILDEPDRGGVWLKDPARITGSGVVAVADIAALSPHFACTLVKRQESA